MSNGQKVTKEQLIKTIERLEKNPNDRVGLLAEIGVTALGAAGAGAAAAVLGTTTASIPIITAVTGIGMAVAAPVTLVAGAAVLGGAAVYGIAKVIKDGGFNEGKRQQLLIECREQLKDVEAKERQATLNDRDKTRLYSLLKEALKGNLIDPADAQQLIQTVESGQISLREAYRLIEQVLSEKDTARQGTQLLLESQTTPSKTTETEKVVTACPTCSQKLRAPSNLGQLTLTCPRCRHSWMWTP